MDQLLKYKSDTLGQLMVLCGAISKPTKAAKANQLVHTLNFHLQLPLEFNILAIDIGIKNFSYCQLHHVNIYDPQYRLNFHNWQTLDLAQKYQVPGTFDDKVNDTVNMKMKLGYLNYRIFKDLIADSKPQPHIVLIENQRVRSNNNSATLPTILLNHTFEHMFYSNYQTLRHYSPLPSQLIPMNSNRMTNFVINRFLDKTQINSKNSKVLRNRFWFHLRDHNLVKVDNIPGNAIVNTKLFLKCYNETASQKISKIDDLLDSFLYNLSFIENFQNNMYLNYYLRNNLDVTDLVWKLNNNLVYKLRQIEGLVFNEYAGDLGHQWLSLPNIRNADTSLYQLNE